MTGSGGRANEETLRRAGEWAQRFSERNTEMATVLDEVRAIVESWTDPVVDTYEERCDRIRILLSEFAAKDAS